MARRLVRRSTFEEQLENIAKPLLAKPALTPCSSEKKAKGQSQAKDASLVSSEDEVENAFSRSQSI